MLRMLVVVPFFSFITILFTLITRFRKQNSFTTIVTRYCKKTCHIIRIKRNASHKIDLSAAIYLHVTAKILILGSSTALSLNKAALGWAET